MIPAQLRGLLDDLAASVMQTSDPDKIDNGRAFGYFLLSSACPTKTIHGIDYWKRQWKRTIRPDYIVVLEGISADLPKDPHPMYSLLNLLQRSTLGAKQEEVVEEETTQVAKVVPVMAEEQIVCEVLRLLRGGNSFVLDVKGYEVETSQPISAPHGTLLRQLMKYVFCLRSIRNSRDAFKGTIGEAARVVVDSEYAAFVDTVSQIDESNSSLIAILSALSGQVRDKIIATTVICEAVAQLGLPCILNSLAKAQTYGLTNVMPITMNMIDAGIQVLTIFIRDWTVYGHLNDKYSEFFVKKDTSQIDDEHWWRKKYVLVEERIPYLLDRQTVASILSSGRAYNFMRKFRRSCVDYVSNFGSTAPFAVNFDQPKMPRVRPDIAWTGPPFELSMVASYSKDAMKSVMYMMKQLLWIPGHLKVVQDFILFARGDFAAMLYQSFSEAVDGDADTLLLHSIKSVTNYKDYTNAMTNECLTDRIDMQKRWTIQPLPSEALIKYLVNPPIDAFLGKDALSKYDMIGQMVWKLKCCECQLASDWRNARRLQYLRKMGFESRNLCFVRHRMMCFIRTITEYLSTDVIICSGKDMEAAMEACEDFDEMLQLHDNRLNLLLKGSFQISQYSKVVKLLYGMTDKINEFVDIVKEVDAVYQSVLNQMRRQRTVKRTTPFFETTKEELAEIMSRVSQVRSDFNDQLSTFYMTCFDDANSVEMQHLENRLYWCVQNLT